MERYAVLHSRACLPCFEMDHIIEEVTVFKKPAITGWYPQFELSKANESDRRRVLDSAAQILRKRVTPESRFYALMEDLADPAVSPFSEIALPYTERLSRLAEPGQPQIGDMPPQPPTLRGRLGAVLVNIVRRMLFWYTAQIRSQQKRIAEAAREQVRALHELSAAERRGREEVGDLTQRLASQEQLLEQQIEAFRNEQRSAAARLDAIRDETKSLLDRMNEITDKTASLQETQASSAVESRREHEKLAARLEQSAADIRRNLRDVTRRLIEQDFLRKPALPAPEPAPALAREMRRLNDDLFVEHARAFRGERAEIKRRLAVYLPFVQKAYAETGNMPALDLGCGRGEWLEALREMGIPARGIDANREFIAGCRELGLDAAEGELPEALCSIPAESCGIVSAIHVLEHLSFECLLEVIDQTVRILKPGGIAIFETPNPKNLFVSSNNFYLDPTHRQPLPSEFLAFVVTARGLSELEVLPLMMYAESAQLQEQSEAAVFINENFFAARDYGIIARKVLIEE
jgi:2-polyprenyl-3-methyl-5-hydroxy-6-metoxy-1,4-benzoquinol methylase